MRRATARLIFAAAAAAGLAGCDGDSPRHEPPEPHTPAPIARVIDGDTGAPVAAVVSADAGGGRVVRLQTGPAGRTPLPAGTRTLRARAAGYSVGRARLRARRAILRVYREELQSPEYGGGPERVRHRPQVRLPPPQGPPAWRFEAPSLIEFPPAVRNGLAVFGTNGGRVYALNTRDGSVRWARRERGPIASTPAMAGDSVYVSSMDGRLTRYRAADGHRIWSFSTGGSPIESSPLIDDERVIVGAWDGTLYAVDARTGRAKWTYRAAGEIKSSVARAGDLLVFGDYGGWVHGVEVATGRPRWSRAAGARFYGGAAVESGLAVIGDVGGQVLALEAATGRERWRRSTGSYVYASPAIAEGRVFIGSYSGRFDALDLDDGSVVWSHSAGERISGSATVVGDVVYTSVLARRGAPRRTVALDTRSGAVRWSTADGRYSPAVAAGRTLYLIGVRTVSAHVSR